MNEADVFDEVMEVVGRYSDFNRHELREEPALQFLGLEIYPEHRKTYCDRQEIHLTAKEYDLICFLEKNKGRVLT